MPNMSLRAPLVETLSVETGGEAISSLQAIARQREIASHKALAMTGLRLEYTSLQSSSYLIAKGDRRSGTQANR